MTVQKPRGGYKPGVNDTVGHCVADGCGLPMLSKWAWQAGIPRADHGCTGSRHVPDALRPLVPLRLDRARRRRWRRE